VKGDFDLERLHFGIEEVYDDYESKVASLNLHYLFYSLGLIVIGLVSGLFVLNVSAGETAPMVSTILMTLVFISSVLHTFTVLRKYISDSIQLQEESFSNLTKAVSA